MQIYGYLQTGAGVEGWLQRDSKEFLVVVEILCGGYMIEFIRIHWIVDFFFKSIIHEYNGSFYSMGTFTVCKL